MCHEVPYPTDYGGVTDLYFKIKSLASLGVKIILHCFQHNRTEQPHLLDYCEEVFYYKRIPKLFSFSLRLPYIVSCRRSAELQKRLLSDDLPVLLEGIHCTYLLHAGLLARKKVFVRLHNVEWVYYSELALDEKVFWKKWYYNLESKLLQRYEKSIANKATFLAVAPGDAMHYQNEFNARHIYYLPVFLPYEKIKSEVGTGAFCLYHGNLAVNENEQAALWLIRHVSEKLSIPLVIAGKKPSFRLKEAVSGNDNTCLEENLSRQNMEDLLRKAHIHVLPAFNRTGIKLKILHGLFQGRFVITNKGGVSGTTLAKYCSVCYSPEEYGRRVLQLMDKIFTREDIAERNDLLEEFSTEKNVRKLMQMIW